MNNLQEVALSNDPKQIEFEIKQYEEMTGKGIYEIGRRLNWVKDKKLVFGEFRPFLKRVGISKSYANIFMSVAKDKELGNVQPDGHLGISVLYEFTKLPNEERDKPQQLDSGEVKKPDDMTRREIQELNHKLKQSEEANKTLDGLLSEKADTISALEQQVKNKPKPEVVEKTVTKEVKPDDYDELKQKSDNYQAMQERNGFLEKQIKGLEERISKLNQKSDEYKELEKDIDDLKKQRSDVRKSIDAGANIMYLNDQLQEMFDTKVSALRYKNFFADDPMTSTVEETEELLDTLQGFIDDMRKVLPQHDRKIIEGKFSE